MSTAEYTMDQLAFRAPEETLDAVEAYADENDLSRSEAGRELLTNALEKESSTDETERIRAEYEREIEELERELERTKRERRQIIEQRDENKELVRYAQNQREVSLHQ
jgi:vacuolar-type H+-ATPase subunit I/STV1